MTKHTIPGKTVRTASRWAISNRGLLIGGILLNAVSFAVSYDAACREPFNHFSWSDFLLFTIFGGCLMILEVVWVILGVGACLRQKRRSFGWFLSVLCVLLTAFILQQLEETVVGYPEDIASAKARYLRDYGTSEQGIEREQQSKK